MFLKNVKYILSAPSKQYWVADDRKEICILGRSNVGKSTFINKITNINNLARVSGKPGYTKYLNFFDVNNSFYLVDTPGYGYAYASKAKDDSFAKMMSEYLYERKNLICAILIVDAKVGITNDDVLLLNMLQDAKVKVQVIASKKDKTNQSERASFLKRAKDVLLADELADLLFYSSLDNRSVDEVSNKILSLYNS